MEGKLIIKKVLLLIAIWCSFTIESLSSQKRISGSNLVDLVIQKLSEQGVSAQPFIKKNRIFTGCSSDKIVISKRDKSWKTIRLTCKDNSSWRYSFRNKVTGTPGKETLKVAQNFSGKSNPQNKQAVLVLTKPKLKGERVEEADIILAEKNKLLSRGAFEDLKLILGKRLKKSLQKGSILKAIHLNPDWLVHKNQRIIIEHSIGSISVKKVGIALNNGAKGDRVLAKNISSNNIIEGFVQSAKKISVFNKI